MPLRYYPNTELLGPKELRDIALGTSTPYGIAGRKKVT